MEKAPELQKLAQKRKNTLPLASFLHCPNPAHGRADIKHSTLLWECLLQYQIWGSDTAWSHPL